MRVGAVTAALSVARCAWNQLSSHIALALVLLSFRALVGRHPELGMSKRFVKFRDDADRKRFRTALADIVACQYAPREPLLAHAGAVPQCWA